MAALVMQEPCERMDLHPRSLGDLFDAAFDLYKSNFALLMTVGAVLGVPAHLAISAAMLNVDWTVFSSTGTPTDSTLALETMGYALLAAVVIHFVWIVQSAALSVAVTDRVLGRPTTVSSCYRTILPRVVRLCVTWVLVDCLLVAGALAVGSFAAFAFSSIIMLTGAAMGETASAIGGIAIIVIPIVTAAVVFALFAQFASQIVTLEGPAYTSAIQRNWELVRGRFWRMVGGCVLLLGIYLSLQVALVVVIQYALELPMLSWLHLSALGQKIVVDGWSVLVELFLTPYVPIFLSLLYLDTRMRSEGLDLLVRAQALRAPQSAGAAR